MMEVRTEVIDSDRGTVDFIVVIGAVNFASTCVKKHATHVSAHAHTHAQEIGW